MSRQDCPARPAARRRLRALPARLIEGAIGFAALASVPFAAAAQDTSEGEEEGRNHLALVIAGTYVDEADETAFTAGIDYEYRLTERVGVGFVAEHAFGELDSTTLLAVSNIHLGKGFAFQIGPGVEFAEGEQFLVARFGAMYEIETGGGFSVAPQVHYDLSQGENAIVFGVAVGKAF